MNKGKKNAYVCKVCGSTIITIDRDEGVTPFMIACRYSGKRCNGTMESAFYRINQQLRASFQWRRASKADKRRYAGGKDMLEHLANGGLILKRWIRGEPDAGAITAFSQRWKQTVEGAKSNA